MSQTRSLRVHKEPVEVELALAGLAPRRVEIFLAEHRPDGFVRQSVLDLVEEVESFLPACDSESGAWQTFNARAIQWIGMARDSAEALGCADELFEHHTFVQVSLEGGATLDGEILYSAPDDESRLVDHLNRPERFFRLWNGDRLYLVRKQSVLRVVEDRGPAS
jgi:hypothetical protein